jgi:hypothetical protein
VPVVGEGGSRGGLAACVFVLTAPIDAFGALGVLDDSGASRNAMEFDGPAVSSIPYGWLEAGVGGIGSSASVAAEALGELPQIQGGLYGPAAINLGRSIPFLDAEDDGPAAESSAKLLEAIKRSGEPLDVLGAVK